MEGFERHPGAGHTFGYRNDDRDVVCFRCRMSADTDPYHEYRIALKALPAGIVCRGCGARVVRNDKRYGWQAATNLQLMEDAIYGR